jgi:hypothetical protein
MTKPAPAPAAAADSAPSGWAQIRNGLLLEGFKGLTLINAGGAAALAAFLQAIWDKPPASPMRAWLLSGIAVLLVGTAISAATFVTRYMAFFHPKSATPRSNPWWWAMHVLVVLSLLCFLVGMGLAVAGGFVALCRPGA